MPVLKMLILRYDAALEFGGRIEDQAMERVSVTPSKAGSMPYGEDLCLVIEESFARNCIQSQLKIHQYMFDNSFYADSTSWWHIKIADAPEKCSRDSLICSST
jgi:hypothetical protein